MPDIPRIQDPHLSQDIGKGSVLEHSRMYAALSAVPLNAAPAGPTLMITQLLIS